MNKIPVLYLSSEAYSKILAVSMLSLLDNKEDNTFYEIYVLVEKKYSEQSLKPFRFMEEKYDGFSLHWIEMEDAFSDTKVNVAGVGKETMYRLMAPKMLAGIDRCIYLDSDTLILSDLEEMFEHDIQDNYFSGIYPERFLSNMLSDYKNAYGRQAIKILEKQIGLCTLDQYVGAGVMIMNLKEMRDHGMIEKFLQAVKPNSLPKDQDILNACCYGHIDKMPVKYCVDLHELDDLAWYEENNKEQLADIQKAFKNPVVIHYSDRYKPWKMCGLRYEKYWWSYLSQLGLLMDFWDDFIDSLGGCNSPMATVDPASISAKTYSDAYREFSKGISYRIGRFITFIPRKIYYFFKRKW